MVRDRDRIYGTVGNITPDANTGIGSWSEQAIGRAPPREADIRQDTDVG